MLYIRAPASLDSTELLTPGSGWQEITSARLCRPMDGVRMNNVDNGQDDSVVHIIYPHSILLFGESRQISNDNIAALPSHWLVVQGL